MKFRSPRPGSVRRCYALQNPDTGFSSITHLFDFLGLNQIFEKPNIPSRTSLGDLPRCEPISTHHRSLLLIDYRRRPTSQANLFLDSHVAAALEQSAHALRGRLILWSLLVSESIILAFVPISTLITVPLYHRPQFS
ncbi:hypothetical protein KEM48_003750 [Puccinia striiformis f. sp. tritici PST-130]|nr:hypothetical protein H4Q26_003325 [Puccinia striiformis f. sp. tritici PST-130]KAI9613622.1 hypothetical protein KEM48_003750 [Puccinia striiformis f. sp. tritici PST-130]